MKAVSRGKTSNPLQSVLVLRDSTFAAQDFSRRSLQAFRPISCTFIDCKFQFMQVRDMCFASGTQQTLYRRCCFDGSKLKVGVVGPARFEDCTFLDVDIKDLMCSAAEFVGCRFSGILRGASFSASVADTYRQFLRRDRNDFTSNDFSAAEMRDAIFLGGVDLDDQRLPTGEGYLRVIDAPKRVESLERAMASWEGERGKAFAILETLKVAVETGQTDIFVTKDSFRRLGKAVADKIFTFLESESAG